MTGKSIAIRKKNILFLHTELAGYFLACLETLANSFDANVHVVRLPVNAEAPFVFSLDDKMTFYDRFDFTDKELYDKCLSIAPDFIFCAGWTDSAYLKITRHFFKKIPTVIVLDNHWTGSIKQQVATLASPAYLLKRFSHIWVPGLFQYEYARKLGFKKEVILTGMYSADVPKFNNYYEKFEKSKATNFPKRFLYVGRYIEAKGVKELWKAFEELHKENASEWELWCAGTGNLEPLFPKHPKMKNLGFIQPQEFEALIGGAGVFILPSHYDAWGVVVHEFAASGMPIVCSLDVGAATAFVINGYNGYSFRSKDIVAIKNAMKRTMALTDMELLQMSERSLTLSAVITPLIWATKIWELTTGEKSMN